MNTMFLVYFKFWSVYLAILDCKTSIWRFPPGPKFEDEGRWMESGPLPRSLPSVISPSWGSQSQRKRKCTLLPLATVSQTLRNEKVEIKSESENER